ncbi:MAG TPA: T9SS type A sorting domain-containing protein, partial [Gemmatimonadota bacterium]|nr:T9SS type A sorting domain-containing protein [Gemmatimonadota bacterium]
DPAIYGQVAYGDIELTWGNTGGVLTLTVHDLSNDVPVQFKSKHGDAFWGFAAETGLGPEEAAYLAARPATPTTATGKVLWPDPLFSAFGGQTAGYGTIWQAGPDWTDLSTNPAIFDLLTPSLSAFIAEFAQPDALSETATLFTCPAAGGNRGCGGAGAGKQGTRFEIYNNWLQVSFNQLPADGETWLLRLPNSLATAPRMPVPGTALRFNLAGGSNELANADLQAITVVPNPFIAANEITRGRGRQRVLFTNLPTQATIRIYTISGNLVRILEHGDGSGTEEWDVRTRFDLLVASGNYYFHVTTPDGRTHLGRFAVIN